MSKSSKSKSKSIKVPKRVAGVKIPKAVRKGPVLQFVNSSVGKVLVAEAITAALAAVAYNHAKTGASLKESALGAEDALKENAARLTHAFSEGVRAFRRALSEDSLQSGEAILEAEEVPAVSKKGYRRPTTAASNPI